MVDGYACFFCGDTIADTDTDPCALLAAAGWRQKGFDGKPQQFFCHAACLRSAAHPSVPLYFLTLAELPPESN